MRAYAPTKRMKVQKMMPGSHSLDQGSKWKLRRIYIRCELLSAQELKRSVSLLSFKRSEKANQGWWKVFRLQPILCWLA
jgi:hypothetical protein